MYTSTELGEGICALFREVSLIRGVLFREVPLYIHAQYHVFVSTHDIVYVSMFLKRKNELPQAGIEPAMCM